MNAGSFGLKSQDERLKNFQSDRSEFLSQAIVPYTHGMGRNGVGEHQDWRSH